MATKSGRKLAGTVHIPPTEDQPEGAVYYEGDVPSEEHAKLITNPYAWAEEKDEEEDDNSFVRNADVALRNLLTEAREYGLEPGKGLPRNPSKPLVARAIRLKQGRATSAEAAGTTPAAKEASVEDELSALGSDEGSSRRGRRTTKATADNDVSGA